MHSKASIHENNLYSGQLNSINSCSATPCKGFFNHQLRLFHLIDHMSPSSKAETGTPDATQTNPPPKHHPTPGSQDPKYLYPLSPSQAKIAGWHYRGLFMCCDDEWREVTFSKPPIFPTLGLIFDPLKYILSLPAVAPPLLLISNWSDASVQPIRTPLIPAPCQFPTRCLMPQTDLYPTNR